MFNMFLYTHGITDHLHFMCYIFKYVVAALNPLRYYNNTRYFKKNVSNFVFPTSTIDMIALPHTLFFLNYMIHVSHTQCVLKLFHFLLQLNIQFTPFQIITLY